MPRIGRTTDGTWHFVGELACHHFDPEDFTEVTAFHETEYDSTPDPDHDDPESEDPPYGDYQDFCQNCHAVIERWERTRELKISDLIELEEGITPDWERGHHDPRKGPLPDCPVCGKPASASNYNPSIDAYACDACVEALDARLEGIDGSADTSTEDATVPSMESNSGPSPSKSAPSSVTADSTTSSERSGTVAEEGSDETTVDTSVSSQEEEGESETASGDAETEPAEATPDGSSDRSRTAPPIENLRDVSGVGTGTITTLRENGYETVADLTEVSSADLRALSGIGATISQRVLDAATDRSTDAPSVDTLRDIPGVGSRTIDALTAHGYQTTADLVDVEPEELRQLPGIGTALSDRIVTEATERT